MLLFLHVVQHNICLLALHKMVTYSKIKSHISRFVSCIELTLKYRKAKIFKAGPAGFI